MTEKSYKNNTGLILSIAYYDIPLRIFFCILTIKLTLFTIYNNLMFLSFIPVFGAILLALSIALLIDRNILKVCYLYLIDALFSLIFIIQSLYYRYFEDFASVNYISQLPQLRHFTGAVISLIKIEPLYISDLAILPFLMSYLCRERNAYFSQKIMTAVVLVALGIYCNANFLQFALNADNPFRSVINRQFIVNYLGIVDYQIWDIFHYLATDLRDRNVNQSDIVLIVNWKTKNNNAYDPTVLDKIGNGMNLVVIQAESLQSFVIKKTHLGKEITPNLNKLINHGIYFDNIYDQTGAGNSSDAVILANCSLYPSRQGAATFLFSNNQYDSLPKILHENGYTTATFHAYKKGFWNFEIFEKSLGFEHQYYENAYSPEEKLGIGLNDRSFFLQSSEMLKKISPPFYATLRNLTPHAPFSCVTKEVDNFELGDLEDSEIGNYLRSMHYFDGAIGEFIESLNKNGFGNTTIIAIYGDHRARISEKGLNSLAIKEPCEVNKVPFIIYIPGQRIHGTIHTLGGVIDFAPTICRILGIDITREFFLGKDLTTARLNYVVFRNGNFISKDESIDIKWTRELLLLSDLIYEKNLLSKKDLILKEIAKRNLIGQ